MNFIRIKHNNFEETMNVIQNPYDSFDMNEWEDFNRVEEPAWIARYQYESDLINNIINNNFPNSTNINILEIGAGIGCLSNLIQTNNPNKNIDYHLIDKPHAQKEFENRNYKGKFFVKDISIDLDTTDLLPKYDLIICNDVLEHLLAPALVVRKINFLMNTNSLFFVSIPNWRMAHQLIYRGLWDYDNFLFFMYIHELNVIEVYPSILQTPHYPKLDSEKCMPDELLRSWNFYFVCKK